ncbi:MAG TPA: selenocysteine-specific translation elongation factor [Bryobacteraceae bacterium]|nr:selenocysteine-specific translation elongation factor [Bryobacteraceae bacterium]
MRYVIAGTAGHIDHGKTALVRALTGVDTDRLEEEKRRGISIDLGFAPLELDSGILLGFVDVPGHERFIRNMLAGASGIDLALLVIAADESIKPQTREHFEICRLLGIRGGVVAVTKSDLVDHDILDLARLEIEEFVAGSFLERAEIVPVSAVTGAGLNELRAALARAAAAIPGKDSSRQARLPIDRSFSMRGHGAVVTGTLVSGTIGLEDELELYPMAKRVRVRGLQVHGKPVERAHAGERTAVNLSGVDSSEARRGMALAPPGCFRPTQRIDCAFELLPGARPLKHGAPVHFHAGTAETIAEARPLGAGFVTFLLREPFLLLPGDRFIVRMFSPMTTIGGGAVVDIDAPARIRKTEAVARLRKLEGAKAPERVELLVSESANGMSVADLAARSGLPVSEIRELAAGPGFFCAADWVSSRAWLEKKLARLWEALGEFHRVNPLLPGWPKEDLRRREFAGAPAGLLDSVLLQAKEIVAEGDMVRLRTHRLQLKGEEEKALAKIESVFAEAKLGVPSIAEALSKSGVESARARTLLQILLRSGKLVRVSEDLVYHASAIAKLRALLAGKAGARFTVADFKEWTGVSRKYAIPLLEFLDRERVTRREGESRVVC